MNTALTFRNAVTAICVLAGAFVGAPTAAQQDKTEALKDEVYLENRTVQRRIGNVLERIRLASGRVEVALLRTFAEIEKSGLNPDIALSPDLPEIDEFDRSAFQDIDAAILLAEGILEDVRVIEAMLVETMESFEVHKGDHIGVPEWSDDVYRGLTQSSPIRITPRSKLLYLDRVTLAIEQVAQRCEVIEEQAITFSNAALRRRAQDRSASQQEEQDASLAPWSFLGPSMIRGGEGHNGARVPVSGRIPSVAVAANGTVYAGAALGGVWRSVDRGETWTPVTDGAPTLAIGALAVDPRKPGRVYAGTGEANVALREKVVVGDRTLTGGNGAGLLVSEDAGETWDILGTEEFSGAAFAELAVSPLADDLLLAATTRGAFLSRDAGRTWQMQRVLPGDTGLAEAVTSSAFHPTDPDRAWVAVWGRGVFETNDMSAARPGWRRLAGGLPLSNIGRIEIHVSGADPDVLYALVSNADHYLRGLYHSTDGAVSWTQLDTAPDILQGQGFYNMLVAADPTDPSRVFLGGVGARPGHASSLFIGRKGFDDWIFEPTGAELHVDFHDIAFDPRDPGTVYVVNDGGIWRSDDGGTQWASKNAGLGITQIMSIDSSAGSGQVLVAGSQDNGTLLWHGGTDWVQGDGGDGGRVRVDPHDTSTIYSVFFAQRLNRSADSGTFGSFEPRFPAEAKPAEMALLAPFDLNPEKAGEVLLGAETIYHSTDHGKTWRRLDSSFVGPSQAIRKAVISSVAFGDTDTAYVGTSDGRIWQLKRKGDGGWQAEASEFARVTNNDELCYVADIVAKPDGTVLLAASDGRCRGLWVVDDGLPQRIFDGLPVYAIETMEASVFIGTEDGVFHLPENQRWMKLGQGLPKAAVFDLDLVAEAELLRAGTFGRGVWEFPLGPLHLGEKG